MYPGGHHHTHHHHHTVPVCHHNIGFTCTSCYPYPPHCTCPSCPPQPVCPPPTCPPPVYYHWTSSSTHSRIPTNAIVGGHDSDRTTIYIGKAVHNGDEIPAKVIPQKKAAYVPYNGKEHAVHSYQVLCGSNVYWQSFNGHQPIPHNAIPAGKTRNGEILYVGRVHHAGSVTIGKVHPSHRCIYIPFGGAEIRYDHGEILVQY